MVEVVVSSPQSWFMVSFTSFINIEQLVKIIANIATMQMIVIHAIVRLVLILFSLILSSFASIYSLVIFIPSFYFLWAMPFREVGPVGNLRKLRRADIFL